MSDALLSIRVQGQPALDSKVKGLGWALDTRAILDEGSATLFNRMRTRFLKETDPTGKRWVPSKAAQQRAKLGKGGGTLFASGRLFQSLQVYAEDETSRAIGTNATSTRGFPYPKVHNFGLANFPQRMFLGFGDEDVQTMTSVVLMRLAAGLSQ